MIAIVVHQVVAITAKLIAQLLDDSMHLLFREVGTADLYALSKSKLIAQFVVVARLNLEDARKRERVAAVRELCAEYLHA